MDKRSLPIFFSSLKLGMMIETRSDTDLILHQNKFQCYTSAKYMATEISFVIPAKNEEGSIQKLHDEIVVTTSKITRNFEIIFIDDGSTDKTFETMKKINK